MKIPEKYRLKIKDRSFLNYYKGFLSRFILYIKYAVFRKIARIRGARIGDSSIIPYKLAINANSNLFVGNDVVIQSNMIDLRGKVVVNDHVIINKDVHIIRVSHHIDNDTFFSTRYYESLIIDSYSWLSTGCKILPSVTKISKGSVVSAYSVLVSNTIENGVYSGSPASLIRLHNSIFSDFIVVSSMGGDFKFYKECR